MFIEKLCSLLLENAGLIITSIVTILGWFLASSWINYLRRNNERKDKMYSFLIEAYFTASKIHSNDFEDRQELESLLFEITDKISLYGSKEQISILSKFMGEIKGLKETGNSFKDSELLQQLVQELRGDIRKHLKLMHLNGQVPNLARNKSI